MKKFSLYDTKISFNQDEERGGLSRKSYSHYELFDETMHFLGSIGFYVGEDKEIKKNYPILTKDRRQGRYSDLEFKASRYPAGFEICFYQNVIFENRYGGFYDFDKRKKMPYLIEKQFALTIKKLSEFFLSRGIYDATNPDYQTTEEKIKFDYVTSWHHPQKDMNFSLADLDGSTAENGYGNNLDRDKKTILNGDVKYFRDYSGYLARGKIYHNINNMWWVIVNKKCLFNKASFELFDLSPDEVRGRKTAHKPPAAYVDRQKKLAEASTKELLRELNKRKRGAATE